MKDKKALHWFRQDLRLSDNPALYEASKNDEVIPIYILDDQNSGEYSLGEASRFWLHHSLSDLNKNLNQNLSLYQGDPLETLSDIIDRFEIDAKDFFCR
jgi:deoxyribodipyrimidine photo-lyase